MAIGTAIAGSGSFQAKALTFPRISILVVNQTGGALAVGDVRRFNTQFSDGAALPTTSASALVSTSAP